MRWTYNGHYFWGIAEKPFTEYVVIEDDGFWYAGIVVPCATYKGFDYIGVRTTASAARECCERDHSLRTTRTSKGWWKKWK